VIIIFNFVAGNQTSMKISFWIVLFCFLFTTESISQKVNWKVGLFSFFDNTEFRQSLVQIPQTMSGVQLAPELGIRWDSVHRVNGGVNLLHEFGSDMSIDKIYITAYYEFNKKPFTFLMGAFPRIYAIEKYPRIFFQDSITYYRPNLNGFFWEIHKDKDYLNIWLDWTNRQSYTEREAFFIGFSGRYNIGTFFLQHFGYMYHFAGVKEPEVDEALHDNWLFLTSVGVDLTEKSRFDKLEFNAGWFAGLDRARLDHTGFFVHNGLLVEAKAEYKKVGIFNSFYYGDGQMTFYNDHSNELYWGDPIYRAETYNRSDFYINFINNKIVNTRFVYSLHFVENTVYNEQSLKVIFNLNNF
jgi:hypothetical protein